MNQPINLEVNGEPKTVDGTQITILCHNDAATRIVPIDPDIFDITPQMTVDWCKRFADMPEEKQVVEMQHMGSGFDAWWKMVMLDTPFPRTMTDATLPQRHVIGLFWYVTYAMYKNKRPFLRLPESYLHPRFQGGLADRLISISDRNPLQP